MQKIYISGKKDSGKYGVVDEEDYGKLSILNWYINPRGYMVARYYGSFITIHTLIMGHLGGSVIDHINGDKLDNRRSNLRFATYGQNVANSSKRTTNKSGYKGVHKNKKGKYIAQVKGLHLGTFSSPEEAAEAYDYAALKAYGEYAYLNVL